MIGDFYQCSNELVISIVYSFVQYNMPNPDSIRVFQSSLDIHACRLRSLKISFLS